MKKTLTILFIAVYAIANCGILLGQHVCMGRVQESALYSKVEKRCGMTMEMHQDMEDCCDDQWQLEIIEDNQQLTSFQAAPLTSYHLLYEVPNIELAALIIDQIDGFDLRNTGPPDIHHPDFYIFYSNLKIPFDLHS